MMSENWAQADVRFEPGEEPALFDLLEQFPEGKGSVIVLGNANWLDFYAMLAPEAVKVAAKSREDVQGLIVFAEMALQQGHKRIVVADVEGMVASVGAAWAAFLVRSVVRLAERHGARVTLTLNPGALSQPQLDVILGSCGTSTLDEKLKRAAAPSASGRMMPRAAELFGVVAGAAS